MKLIKTLAVTLSAAIALMGTATAQAPGYGPGPQHGGGQGGYTGAANTSPQVARHFNNSSYRAIQGNMMAVVSYALNGECGATIGGRTGGRAMSAQFCRYSVQEIGPGRVQMRSVITMNGQTMQDVSVLQLRPDGSLFDETARIQMVRIQ